MTRDSRATLLRLAGLLAAIALLVALSLTMHAGGNGLLRRWLPSIHGGGGGHP